MALGARPGSGTATVLFTDLVGSTELRARLGEDAAETLRRTHDALLADAVSGSGGAVVKNLGDGLMATFAGAADAVSAAVTIQQAIDRHNARADAPQLAVRVGISVGDITWDNGDYFGTPVIEAARLCAAARGGQILVADLVRALARGRGGHAFESVGALALKGLPDPVPTCAVSWVPLPRTVPLPSLLASDPQFALAGREAELATLQALWEEARSGQRRVVLLSGEPGIGKTRLAAELARRAYAADATVLYGRCDEEMGVPFQPFVEALRYFIDHSPAGDLRILLGRYPEELVRIVPELAKRLPGLDPPLRSDAETERYRLFDAIATWLERAAAYCPVLLVLDDLHWASKPTLLLLRHVSRTVGAARLFVFATHRDTDVDREHPLPEIVSDMRRDAGVERIELRGLDEAGVVAFVEGASGQATDAAGREFARALHAETEGNPFFVGEVLRHLVESGAILRRDGRWVSDRRLAEIGIPPRIRDVVGHRLGRLSAATHDVLTAAAVVGRDFDVGVVAAVAELGEDRVVALLDHAVTARLVEETGVDSYRFAHSLVRSSLYETVSASRRARLHRRVGEALEARHPDDLTGLAFHFTQAAAGQITKAVEYTTRAAEQAVAALAHDQAVVLYREALGLVDATKQPDPARRAELLVRLGEAERDSGDGAYRQTLLDAARYAASQGDAARLARAALANSRGYFSSIAAVDTERVAVLEDALRTVDPAASATCARLLATLASELFWSTTPERQRARALADEALTIARRLDDPATLAHVLRVRYIGMWAPDTLAERRSTADELIALAERLGDPHERWWALNWRVFASVEACDFDDVDRHLAVIAELTEQLGQPVLRWNFARKRVWRTLLRGDTAEAERIANEAFELGQTLRQPDTLVVFGAEMVSIRFIQGRYGESEPLTDMLLAENPDLAMARAAAAELYACDIGRAEDARALLRRDLANGFADQPWDLTWLSTMTYYARATGALDDRAAAAALYERLAPWHDRLPFEAVTINGAVSVFLGILATRLGRFAEAEAHFAEAEALHARIGAPYWLAFTRLELARMLLARHQDDDAGRARQLVDEVLRASREHGFAGLEHHAGALGLGPG
jgi:class 3 adenylate cyclase/tetratricopeptide (TPR) repeat protein